MNVEELVSALIAIAEEKEQDEEKEREEAERKDWNELVQAMEKYLNSWGNILIQDIDTGVIMDEFLIESYGENVEEPGIIKVWNPKR
jgi:hypothetical protein